MPQRVWKRYLYEFQHDCLPGQQTGKTDKNVHRHSLDRLYARMIKQGKNPASTCWASENPHLRSSLTHSSAFSFSGIRLCARYHGISMVMSGLALRSTTMCFWGDGVSVEVGRHP